MDLLETNMVFFSAAILIGILLIFILTKITDCKIVNLKMSSVSGPPGPIFEENFELLNFHTHWDKFGDTFNMTVDRSGFFTQDAAHPWTGLNGCKHQPNIDTSGNSVGIKDLGCLPSLIRMYFYESGAGYFLGFGATENPTDHDYEGGGGAYFHSTRLYDCGFMTTGEYNPGTYTSISLSAGTMYYCQIALALTGGGDDLEMTLSIYRASDNVLMGQKIKTYEDYATTLAFSQNFHFGRRTMGQIAGYLDDIGVWA